MNVSHPSPNVEMTRIELARGALARIRDAQGSLMLVREGTVWITQSGSTHDAVVKAGESFRIDRDGLTLISACGPLHHALVTLAPEIRSVPSPAKRFLDLVLDTLMPSRASVRGV